MLAFDWIMARMHVLAFLLTHDVTSSETRTVSESLSLFDRFFFIYLGKFKELLESEIKVLKSCESGFSMRAQYLPRRTRRYLDVLVANFA